MPTKYEFNAPEHKLAKSLLAHPEQNSAALFRSYRVMEEAICSLIKVGVINEDRHGRIRLSPQGTRMLVTFEKEQGRRG